MFGIINTTMGKHTAYNACSVTLGLQWKRLIEFTRKAQVYSLLTRNGRIIIVQINTCLSKCLFKPLGSTCDQILLSPPSSSALHPPHVLSPLSTSELTHYTAEPGRDGLFSSEQICQGSRSVLVRTTWNPNLNLSSFSVT